MTDPYPDEPQDEHPAAVPPHDLDAERAVLGGMLTRADAIDDATEVLTGPDFYQPAHEWIFDAITALHRDGKPVDAITVADALTRAGHPGAAPTLADLVGVAPFGGVAYHARIVARKAIDRRLVAAGQRVTALGLAGADDAVELARAEIDACSQAIGTLHLVGDRLAETIDRIGSPAPSSVPTPWADLNVLIGGWRPGALYVVGARPGVGKSLLALGAALGLAQHGAVAWSSLEMPEGEVHERMLAAVGQVRLTAIKDGPLTDAQWDRLAEATRTIATLPISVDDRTGVTATDVRSHARTLHRRHPLAAVIVDYVQLMSAPRGDKRDRHVVVGEFSRALKTLAMEMRVPVIALSQLNRASLARADAAPTMADLRESGSLEQDSDVVILLHQVGEDPTLHVSVAKNRHGQTGGIRLTRRGEYARIDNHQWTPSSVLDRRTA